MNRIAVAKEMVRVARLLTGALKFDVSVFKASHGRDPKGRGTWAFGLYRDGRDAVFSPSMTYQDAKKWAAKQPAFADVDEVIVLP